jgi:hypothetical protein
MRRIIAAAILAVGIPAASDAQDIREINCRAVDADSGRNINIGRYSVIRESRRAGPFRVEADSQADISGLVCRRTSPIPQPNDYKVALAGLALYVSSRRHGQTVRTALYVEDDQFVFRILEGRLTQGERGLAAERIEAYYVAVNGSSSEGSTN